MRVVFMGTPEFARATLQSLCESDHVIPIVVTGRDKPAGRHRKLTPTEVRVEAEKRGLPVLTPNSLKEESLYQSLRELNPDIFVVAAFRILPPKLFELPRLGSINIHASILPQYRGAAPIQWALINGDKETGLTSFFLKKQVDTGDVILQEKTDITDNDNYDTLHTRLSKMAGPFLLKTLDLIEKGVMAPAPQNDAEASRAPKIGPFDAMIDFGLPAVNVRNFVRGLATKPGAYSSFRGKKIKVHACSIEEASGADPDGRPGTILPDRKRLLVRCGRSKDRATAVELLKLVPAGKKEMDGVSFVNGFHPEAGEVFGEKILGAKEKP